LLHPVDTVSVRKLNINDAIKTRVNLITVFVQHTTDIDADDRE